MTQPPSSINRLTHDMDDPGSEPKRAPGILITLLGLQILLLLLIFPWLLVYFENEYIRQKYQQGNEKILNELPSSRSFSEGLYWSLITPISMGTDNTWPQSRNGRILVRVSDATKVLIISVIARLAHVYLNTRRTQQASGIGDLCARRRGNGEMSELHAGQKSEDFGPTRKPHVVFRGRNPQKITRIFLSLLLSAKRDSSDAGVSGNGHPPTDGT